MDESEIPSDSEREEVQDDIQDITLPVTLLSQSKPPSIGNVAWKQKDMKEHLQTKQPANNLDADVTPYTLFIKYFDE